MLQEVVQKFGKRSWLQSELNALTTIQKYGEELGIKQEILDQAKDKFLELKIEYKDDITNNTVLASVCLIYIVKSNKFPISPKVIMSLYKKRGHRITPSVMNRIMLDFGLKNPVIKPEIFVHEKILKLKQSEDIIERIELKELNPFTFFRLLEKATKSYLSFLDISYKGGSPPSILAVYGIYLGDKILQELYYKGKGDRRSILNKKLVSKITGAKVSSCSSPLIAKMNKCMRDNQEKITEELRVDLDK